MKKQTHPKRRLRGLALASAVMVVGGALGLASTGPARADGPATGAVKQVDHVLIGCSDDTTAQAMFNQFTSAQGFDLPVAWPYNNYGNFSSGGVYVGANGSIGINLEFGVYNAAAGSFSPGNMSYQSPPAGTCRYVGLALEPGNNSQTQAENALQSAGISYQEQVQQAPAFSPPFALMHSWTNIQPTGLSSPTIDPNHLWLQITAYNNAWFQTGGWASIEAYKAADQQVFPANGGPLTMLGASSISIHSTNQAADIAGLNQLFAPVAADANNTYDFGTGPLVRVNSGSTEGVYQLTLKVSNLGTARSYLTSHGMLGTDDGSSLTIAPNTVDGLNIRVVQTGN